ncbi:hypothetical protein Tco_0001715 [Tanacetum coccineum]
MEPNSFLPYIATKYGPLLDNITGYQKLLGKLIYLTHTRPDISYSIHCLAQYMHSPLKSHFNCALNVLRYPPNVGEILTTIGRDINNHIFPVAWAMVNVENKDNWSWFLELLGEDLDLPTGNGLTLISDQYKNIDNVQGTSMRVLENYIVVWNLEISSGLLLKLGTNCEAVENGFSECFNAFLLRVRNKRLITMLEAMRVTVMERMNTMRRMLDKWTYDICPNIQKRLELNKDQQRFAMVER